MARRLRMTRGGTVLAAALLTLPGLSAAQSFSGTGPGATAPFVLLSGERFVAVSAAAPGSFTAFLLSQDGSVVATLKGADQRHRVRVPSDGRYLFDIRAQDEWSISVEEPDPVDLQRARGRIDGAEAGSRAAASGAWLGKGLIGGLLAGPIGTAFVYRRAGSSEPVLPETLVGRLARENVDYGETFREAYTDEWRGSQRSAALIGGITGTAVLTFAILQATVWRQQPTAKGGLPGDGETAVRIPFVVLRITP